MAYANVNPFILSWKQQGLEYLLSESVAPENVSLCNTHANSARKAKNDQLKQEVSGRFTGADNQVSPAYVQSSVERNWSKVKERVSSETQKQEKLDSVTQKTEENTIMPLPSAWKERLDKTVATSVLFSYLELGYDLYGQVDANRRHLFLQLITKDLKQPANAYSFWPVALPESGTLVPDATAYWNGVKILNARGVVIFGEKSAQAVGLAAKSIVGNFFWHNGCQVLVAPALSYSMESEDNHQKMVRHLKKILLAHMSGNRTL